MSPLHGQNLSAQYGPALSAATQAAGAQHYPAATLYLVATPIGNLADISLRALHVLQIVDAFACEDTRTSSALLRAYGLDVGRVPWLALHQHNEAQSAQRVIERLRQGQRVAYLSDAGTPGVSDPGARLVAAVRAAGLGIVALPGPSCVTTLVSTAGAIDEDNAGFVFTGFLPSKPAERMRAVQALAQERRAVVMLEAPHRILALARDFTVLGSRAVTVGRELSKQFEEVATVEARALTGWLNAGPHRTRGEFALLLHPLADPAANDALDTRALRLLMAELPLARAARLAAELTGQSRKALYAWALAQAGGASDDPPVGDAEFSEKLGI
ncbi:MAG: 16S rRNA (cytidine(1402)-2'-O)-methyltransferase [Rhodoferax sp.]